MSRTRRMSLDILRRSCTSPQVLEIVEHIAAWYDGSRQDLPLRGRQIPLGARMIAIVEAFDAMTTDHVYRPARSQERAMAELFECSGTQFDPELVERFAEFRQGDQTAIHWEVAHRWLRSLEPDLVDSYWELNYGPRRRRPSRPSTRCSRTDCWRTCTTRWCLSTPRAASACGTGGRSG